MGSPTHACVSMKDRLSRNKIGGTALVVITFAFYANCRYFDTELLEVIGFGVQLFIHYVALMPAYFFNDRFAKAITDLQRSHAPMFHPEILSSFGASSVENPKVIVWV